jgi:hypothetical protein
VTAGLDQLLADFLSRIEDRITIEAIEIEDEIAKPRSLLKVLDAEHFNWRGEPFRKLFAMRFRVKLPPLDQVNTIFYPRPEYSAPIFIFFCLLTRRKVIGHLNVNCPFDDVDYRARWVDPLVELRDRYPSFDCDDRYPEWMKKYRNDCTIYGMLPRDRFDDLRDCALDYLGYYLEQLDGLAPETDPGRRARIEEFHAGFINDIRTQDKAQGMMAKMIGKDKARRIFFELTT